MSTATLVRHDTVAHPREVERLVAGQATSDGAGVKLTRVLTQPLQRRLDPYLMLDAFGTDRREDYIGGFPDHPHRGFETITYMLNGRMRHRDSAGNEGLISVRRESTFLRYTANTEALRELLQFLYAECCTRNQAVRPQEIVQICN